MSKFFQMENHYVFRKNISGGVQHPQDTGSANPKGDHRYLPGKARVLRSTLQIMVYKEIHGLMFCPPKPSRSSRPGRFGFWQNPADHIEHYITGLS
jgi:hypothetical protein